MARIRFAPLGLAASLALLSVTSGRAQFTAPQPAPTTNPTTPSTTTQAPSSRDRNDGDRQRQSPFNDPKARLRGLKMSMLGLGGGFGGFGGRGGFGGGGPGGPGGGGPGGPGGGPNSLVTLLNLLPNSEVLQEELKLTEQQKLQLKKVSEQADQQRSDFFRQMRDQNNNNRGNDNDGGDNGGRGGRGGRGGFDPEQMRQAMQTLASQSEMAMRSVLKKDQLSRLEQIGLQIRGPLAIPTDPAIARYITVTPAQAPKLQALLADLQGAMQDQMRSMFQRGGPGGPGGQGGPGGPGGNFAFQGGGRGRPGQGNTAVQNRTAPGADPKAQTTTTEGNNANTNRGGRGQGNDDGSDTDREQMRQAFMDRMRENTEKQDQLVKEAEQKLASLLNKTQKDKFNRALGKPFDLEKFAASLSFGGNRGGPGGGNNNDNNNSGFRGRFGGGAPPQGGNPPTRPNN